LSRSYLFVPGNNPAMLQQMDVFEADAIIIDLEDSVLDYDKDAALDLVHNFLAQLRPQHLEVFIRINAVDHPQFTQDIKRVNEWKIDGIVLPKATLYSLQLAASKTTKPIIPILETPMGILDAREMATLPRVLGFLLGGEDLTKELHIARSKEGKEILYARQHIIMVASAYQKRSIDTPFVSTKDFEGLQEEASFAKAIGFSGKAVIHPNHVPIINRIFLPSEEELQEARRILKKAKEVGSGAFSLDGKMVDKPIIEKARSIIKQYEIYTRK